MSLRYLLIRPLKDQFGLKIKLPNGNVASRVLPVRIHDLDIDDIKQCESVLEGVYVELNSFIRNQALTDLLSLTTIEDKLKQNKVSKPNNQGGSCN